jgi:hypothetical protein
MLCDNAPPNKSPQPTGPIGPRCIDALESTAPIGARKQRRSCICWQSCGGVDSAGPAPQLYAAGCTDFLGGRSALLLRIDPPSTDTCPTFPPA